FRVKRRALPDLSPDQQSSGQKAQRQQHLAYPFEPFVLLFEVEEPLLDGHRNIGILGDRFLLLTHTTNLTQTFLSLTVAPSDFRQEKQARNRVRVPLAVRFAGPAWPFGGR